MLIDRMRFLGLSGLMVAIVSVSTDAESSFKKQPNPFSHTYVQEFLKDITSKRAPIFLNTSISHTQKYFALDGFRVNTHTLLNGGLIAPFYEMPSDSKRNSLRGSLTVGNFYKYPWYIRCGYDYIPIGYNSSAVIVPQSMVTRSMLQDKNLMVEAGNRHWSMHSEWQYSLALLLTPSEVLMGTLQYTKGSNSTMIKRYKLGLGAGIGDGQAAIWRLPPQKGCLFNLYSISELKGGFNLYWEYLYNNAYTYIKTHYDETLMYEKSIHSPHNLHIELFKNYPQMAIAGWRIPLMVVVGYEKGSILKRIPQINASGAPKSLRYRETIKYVNNAFFAIQLTHYKYKQITFLGGAHYNFTKHLPEAIFKIEMLL